MNRNLQRFFVLLWIAVLPICLLAMNGEGAISADLLQEFQESLKMNEMTKAAQNAATETSMRSLILNREMVNRADDHFNFRIDTKKITDQKTTGRCWIYAALNMMRPAAMKALAVSEIEFSQNYLFFYDKLEKANMFLETIIETADRPIDDRELHLMLESPIADGGWWTFVVALIEKYGIVPNEIMPETVNCEKSRYMNFLLNNVLRKDAYVLREMASKGKKTKALRKEKEQMLAEFYRLLAIHLGTPPQEFTWRYQNKKKELISETYTPLSFLEKTADFDLGNFITIANHPSHEMDTHYKIKYCRNFADLPDMHFLNLEMDRLKEFSLTMVLDSVPVWFAADTRHDMERDHGIMAPGIYDYKSLFGVDFTLPKKARFEYRGSIPGHAMALIGVDLENEQPRKWLVENSWGTDIGNKGYWTMYDAWFNEYIYVVIIDKQYLPDDVLALLETKAEELPLWDPISTMLIQ